MKNLLFFVAVAILLGILMPATAQKSKLFKVNGVLTAISENPVPKKKMDTLDLNLKVDDKVFEEYASSIAFLINNNLDSVVLGTPRETKGKWVSPFVLTIDQVFLGILIKKGNEIIFKENIKMENIKRNYFYIFSSVGLIFLLLFYFVHDTNRGFLLFLFSFVFVGIAALCAIYKNTLPVIIIMMLPGITAILSAAFSLSLPSLFKKGKAKNWLASISVVLVLTGSILMYLL